MNALGKQQIAGQIVPHRHALARHQRSRAGRQLSCAAQAYAQAACRNLRGQAGQLHIRQLHRQRHPGRVRQLRQRLREGRLGNIQRRIDHLIRAVFQQRTAQSGIGRLGKQLRRHILPRGQRRDRRIRPRRGKPVRGDSCLAQLRQRLAPQGVERGGGQVGVLARHRQIAQDVGSIARFFQRAAGTDFIQRGALRALNDFA